MDATFIYKGIKMKSLEKTIRLVHEGKCCCEKKKSLEHTIRKVREGKRDDIDAPLGKVAESKVDVLKGLEKIAGLELKEPTSLGQLVVVGKEQLPALVKKAEKKVKTNLPAEVKPETKVVAKPETPTTTATATKTEVPTTTATATKTAAEIPTATPVTTTEPKQSIVSKVATALGVPAGLVATKTTTPTATKAVPAVAPKEPVPPAPPAGTKPKIAVVPVPGISMPKPSLSKDDYMDVEHRHRPPTLTHRAKKRLVHEDAGQLRKKIENMPRPDAGDRKEIEYVGRVDDNPLTIRSKTARNSEIKHKIIDEARKMSSLIKKVHKDAKKEAKEYREDGKTKVYPNVIINPDLNRVDLNTYVDSGKVPNDYK